MRTLLLPIAIFFITFSTWAAKEVGCTYKSALINKEYSAPMFVECGDKKGYVRGDVEVGKLQLSYITSDGVSKKVSVDLSDLNLTTEDLLRVNINDDVRKKIPHLRRGDTVAIQPGGLFLAAGTPLYETAHAKTLSPLTAGEACDLIGFATVFRPKNCETAMCLMDIRCEGLELRSICPVRRDGKCPTPTECVKDKNVEFLRGERMPRREDQAGGGPKASAK